MHAALPDLPGMDQDVLVLSINLEEPANELLRIGSRPAEGRKISERDPDAQRVVSAQKCTSRVRGGERVRCSPAVGDRRLGLIMRCVSRRPRAEANGVATRLQAGGTLWSEACRGLSVLCDRSTGATRPGALRRAGWTIVIAELHGFLEPGISRSVERFAASHSVELVRPSCPLWPPDTAQHRRDLLRFLAVWEWRVASGSGAVMHARELRRT